MSHTPRLIKKQTDLEQPIALFWEMLYSFEYRKFLYSVEYRIKLSYTFYMKCYKCKNIISHNTQSIYGLHKQCFEEWFHPSDSTEFKNIDPKTNYSDPEHNEIKKKKDTFFHGRYLKYSASLNETSYILKMQEDQYPELPAIEYLCNEIANILNIEVPAYFLINFNQRLTFVTRNFMQDYTGTLHHIYEYLPSGDENHSCEKIIKVILNETEKLSEVVKFIYICLFDALVGNNDRHGRNLGIIQTAHDKFLAPMYDNPCFLGIEEESMLEADYNISGSIWTKKSKEPKLLNYIKEFERLGYKEITDRFKSNVLTKTENIRQTIERASLSHKRKGAFIKFFKKRMEDFKND